MTPLVVRLLLEQFIMLCLHLDASHWKRNHLVAEPQDACIDSVVLPLLRIIPCARFLELFVHALSNAMIITCVTPNHYLSSSNVHFTLWNASQSSHTSCIQKNVGCKGRHYPHLSSNHTILRKCIHSSTYSTPLHSCMMFLLLMELQAPFLESTCIDHGTCITRNGNGSQCRRIQTCIQCCYYFHYFTRHLGTCTTMDVHVTGREILSSFHQYFDTCLCHALYNHANVSKTARTQLSFSQFLTTYMLYSLLYNNFNNNQFTTILSKSSSMIGSDHSRKFTNHSNGDNNNNNTSGRTSRQSNHSSSGSGNIQSSSSSRSSSNSEQQQQQQQVQTGRILTHDHNNTSDHLFALIDIIDGTQKEKNGIKYWVQRNVITIQVISSFVFDTCTINCNKEGSTEVKHMETLSFVDSFAKMNESKIMELNLSTLRSASTYHEIYEAQFRKKLPYTSGRPETQKLIWLSAEFSLNNQIIKTVISPKFYVCSRPQDLRGVTRVGQASSSEETQSSSQSRHAAKMAAQKSVIRGMVSVIPRKQFMAESNPPQQQPSLPPTMTNTTTTLALPLDL
ncbi:hypothetical protein C9374_000188 [Naegleria lovaniensis]|uniref:Uncharacterized protein n=1 Tax=Naegleria lovaniensis TaxID=51637 RepID=A0AA88KP53_NAELO|nr:uncharacterized protein C9374_000188 [Naegleria lovaniensis]KAG2388749.1 hypothetical protein C9374_000188 [Naegleria lovaniensis]